MKRKLLSALILFTGLSAFFTLSASAYVDPTTTTFLFQALAGVVAVVGTAIVIWWRRAKRKVRKALGIDENKNMEVEDEFAVVDEQSEESTDAKAEEETEENAGDESDGDEVSDEDEDLETADK